MRICILLLFIMLNGNFLTSQINEKPEKIKNSKIKSVQVITYKFNAEGSSSDISDESITNYDTDGYKTDYVTKSSGGYEFRYTYDKGKDISSQSLIRGELFSETKNEYDENGRESKLTTIIKSPLFEEHDDTIVTIYDYDENGFKSAGRRYMSIKNNELSSITYYVHDENGNLLEENIYNEDSTLSSSLVNVYDINNNRIEHKFEMNDTYMHFKYEYNEAGDLIKSTQFDKEGVVINIQNFYYTGSGNVIRAHSFDKNGNKACIWVYVYSYYE